MFGAKIRDVTNENQLVVPVGPQLVKLAYPLRRQRGFELKFVQ